MRPSSIHRSAAVIVLLVAAPGVARAQDDDEGAAAPRGSERLIEIVDAAEVDWVDLDGPIPATSPRVQVAGQWFRIARDGRTFWLAGEDGEPSRITALGRLPHNARLVPVLDMWAAADMASPTGWAVLVPGSPWAGTSEGPLPLERAPASSGPTSGVPVPGPSIPDRAAFAEITVLRTMRTCPSGRGPCVLYGPTADVEAAEDARHPVWGYVLEPRATPVLPAEAPIHREVARDGDVAVEIDEVPVAGDAWTDQPIRAWLVIGSRRVHAFDAVVLQGFEPSWELVRYGGDLVVMAKSPSRIALSRHDPRTGARRGPATRVEAVAYYHDCDDNEWLEPVLTARGAGFVLVSAEDEEHGVYWPSPTSRGRVVALEPPAEGDYGAVVRYTFEGNGLRPVGR